VSKRKKGHKEANSYALEGKVRGNGWKMRCITLALRVPSVNKKFLKG
jgi:hypothetical protein